VQNDKKNTKKPAKRTHPLGRKQYMCFKMLRLIRQDMLYDPRDMCDQFILNRRTYQDYEAGKRGIPQELADRVRELYAWDKDFMANIGSRVDAAEKGNK
jgi:hypothetical protein